MDQENRLDVEQMIELLEKHDFKKLKEELESVHPVDIVDALEELDKKQRILIFRLLAKEEAAEVFTDMNSDMREDLINALLKGIETKEEQQTVRCALSNLWDFIDKQNN